MKININYLEHDIQIQEGYISVLEIENKKYFYRIINDFYSIYNSNIIEDITFLNEEDQEINYSNKLKIFINYFDFNFDSKKYINEISKYVNDQITEKDRDTLAKQYAKIVSIYKRILNDIDLPLSVESEINMDNLTKLMKININYKHELLDNLLLLIDLEKVLENNNLLIFINLKQYLNKEELQELYKYSIYNHIQLLLIDSQSYGVTLNNEIKLIIDENLDEFML